jgi:hypothetical protein
MFVDELAPLFKELTGHPVAFLGGFFSGLLRLNLSEDPIRTWLNSQMGTVISSGTTLSSNGRGSGPQSISID